MGKKLIIKGSNFAENGLNDAIVGIEFLRGSSNGGSSKGYYNFIGSQELVDALFGRITPAVVKDARVTQTINQTNWYKDKSGNNVDLSGADGSDIMMIYPDMYAILGGTDETYERWIFSNVPFTYKGDTAEFIPSFGDCPDYELEANGVARSILTTEYGHIADSNSSSSYYSTKGFPAVSKTRAEFENLAKAKNSNTSSNLPYFNGTTIDARVIIGMLYVECRTKDIISIFGNGISSNITITETNWDTISGLNATSGIRYKLNGAASYTYKKYSDTAYPSSSGSTKNFNTILFGNTSHTKVLDVQSEISKNNITLTPVTNTDGLTIGSGTMTGVATIKRTITATFGSSTSNVGEQTVEIVEHIPVWRGRTNLFGNIWSTLSGTDVIEWSSDGTLANTFRSTFEANSVEDITSNATESATSTTLAGAISTFGLSNYEKIGERTIAETGGSGYCTTNESHENGNVSVVSHYNASATLHTYECAYQYRSTISTAPAVGSFSHKQAGFLGGYASDSYASVRSAYSNYGPSLSHTLFGSRFRVKITK